ncbi:putative reverse transcriptase domain, exostosin [Helianthus annuus]|nr:putative reverse transcriptase domain, exostosin [Helianthus annuus]
MAPRRGGRNVKSGGHAQGSDSGLKTCPFKFFHDCKDGKPGSVGFFRLFEHMQSTHLKTENRRLSLKEAISNDLDLFMDVAEVFRAGDKWLCGKCMVMHALSRGCKHDNEVVSFAMISGGVEDFIVGIGKPCQVVVDTNPPHPARLGSDVNLLERVFSLPIQTVKSIPPSCRLLFAQVLTGALRKVVASPGSVNNWVQLLLLPRCTLRVVRPSSRQERRSGNRKSLQCSNILHALTVWKDGSGFDDLVASLLDSVGETGAPRGECRKEEEKERDPNIKQCLRKVRDGHFTAAVKVLCSSGVAPLADSTLKALIDKHPVVSPPSLPSNPLAQPTLVVDGDCVLKCIRSFPKGTSCGRDGMRAQHLLDAIGGEGSVTSSGLLTSITEVVNLWLGGSCPMVLAEFVASAPLTPLLKPDKGIRPIAVGGIWRRLVSKVAMKKVGKEMAQYLGDYQFGVGMPNGAEAVLHSANRFLNSFHADGSLALLTVDFSNAFNTVDRTTFLQEVHQCCPSIYRWVQFLYAQPARLYVGNECIGATTGVQQGEPLGPLLFALALHPLILRVQNRCKLPFHAWYLDDGTIIGNASEVAKALDIINEEGPSLGLYLNIKKIEVYWPTCDDQKVQDRLFPRGIGRPEKWVKLLSGVVSRDPSFIGELAGRRASGAVDLMKLLPCLRDPQCELLLLRSCMGVAKLLFGLRTCQPHLMEDAVTRFDDDLRKAIEDIVVGGGPFFGDLQWRLASLPMRLGGLGLFSARDVGAYAFVASRAQSWELQDHILRNGRVVGLDPDYQQALERLNVSLPDLDIGGFSNKDTAPSKPQKTLANALFSKIAQSLGEAFDLSPRQKAVFECLKGPHAQEFLTVIPIEGLGQCMSAVEYRTILKYRLMIPMYPEDETCPICRKACMDKYGEHAVHCKELPGFKYRNDWVRDVLGDILRRAGISAKKEAPVNFLTDPMEGRSTLRPADLLVFGWAGGKHACVDLTGVSPLVGLRENGFVAGLAARKAELKKVDKHAKACAENQHVFIPFAFDTFGSLAPEAINFLTRVQRVIHSNCSTPRGQGFVFGRLGFAIQKGLAAQLVARLPSVLM